MALLALALHEVSRNIDFEIGLIQNDPVEAEVLDDKRVRTDSQIMFRFPSFTYGQNYAWRLRLAQAADDLVGDITGGRPPYPRCLAEEALLILALDGEMNTLDSLPDVVAALPVAKGDYDWDTIEESLFEDGDMRVIFDARFGRESRYADVVMAMDDHYAAEAWFHWFGTFDPRPNRETDPMTVTGSIMLPERGTDYSAQA